MADDLVLHEQRGAVAVLTLNNPARRNALSSALLARLRERLLAVAHAAAAPREAATRCIVLRAVGTAFSSGHDLREVAAADQSRLVELFALCSSVMETIRTLPVPVIAEVQGVATAAGCQLAATCDLVLAADVATFATPGVKIGLFCSTPAVALSRAVCGKKALEMLLTGREISAAEAERIGLVNRVVPLALLSGETLAVADKIAAASGEVLRIGKRSFYEQLALDRPAAYRVAEGAMVENAAFPDAAEGITAFLDKRAPRWKA